jgi:phosphoribosylaminoimidazole-succinocarboxamide synthase
MISDDLLRAQLSRTLDSTDLGLGERLEGKVRDSYRRDGQRIIVATDRISAFDKVLGTIPWKGQVLNQLAAHWFTETRHVAPNHVLSVPDPNVTVAREVRILPVEVVVRGYLTGVTNTSIWRRYLDGERVFGGLELPAGMRKNEPLTRPVITPTTKAEKGGHDENITRLQIVERGLVDQTTWERVEVMALAMFAFGQQAARARGLMLVDTKYELGVDSDGQLVFADEIHTPDSSRYWYADDYEARLGKGEEPRSLDKEYVRRHYVETAGYRGDGPPPPIPDEVRMEAARRYVTAFELVTGKTFEPDLEDPNIRIRRNLEKTA